MHIREFVAGYICCALTVLAATSSYGCNYRSIMIIYSHSALRSLVLAAVCAALCVAASVAGLHTVRVHRVVDRNPSRNPLSGACHDLQVLVRLPDSSNLTFVGDAHSTVGDIMDFVAANTSEATYDSVFWGLHTSTGSVLVNRSIPLAVAGVKPGSQLEVLGRLLGGTKKPVSLPSGMLLVWEWVMPQSVFRR